MLVEAGSSDLVVCFEGATYVCQGQRTQRDASVRLAGVLMKVVTEYGDGKIHRLVARYSLGIANVQARTGRHV